MHTHTHRKGSNKNLGMRTKTLGDPMIKAHGGDKSPEAAEGPGEVSFFKGCYQGFVDHLEALMGMDIDGVWVCGCEGVWG